MKSHPWNDLEYFLLSSATPLPEHKQVHNDTFTFWRDSWRKTFSDLGFTEARLEEDFLRQDIIACITHQRQPVAVHLYTFFSLDSEASRSHPYLATNYPEIYFEKLKRMAVNSVMSMEYMVVHPSWRKKKHEVHLGSVLVGLALQTMNLYGYDAAIAPARRDHKVNEIAYSFGGESVISNVNNHNVPCDLLACLRRKMKPNPMEAINQWVNGLWQKRVISSLNPLAEDRSGNVLPLRRAA